MSKKSSNFGLRLASQFPRIHVLISHLKCSNDYYALSCKLQSFMLKITLVQAQTKFLGIKSCKFEKNVVILHSQNCG